MDENNNFLTSKQAGKILGIHQRTIQRLTKQGKIKGVRIGKLLKYRKVDIDKYLLSGTNFSKEPARIPNDFIERRLYPRINTNFNCQYSITLPPFKNINGEGIIKNISAGGVFLINRNNEIFKINIDDPVDLDFNLDINSEIINIDIKGKIVREDSNGIGIKFRNIDGETKNKIVQYAG